MWIKTIRRNSGIFYHSSHILEFRSRRGELPVNWGFPHMVNIGKLIENVIMVNVGKRQFSDNSLINCTAVITIAFKCRRRRSGKRVTFSYGRKLTSKYNFFCGIDCVCMLIVHAVCQV